MKWLALILALLASPAWAVDPSEMLDDPVLEERARELSKGLRCPVCQNESIDESNAVLAHELRVVLRERLVAGDTDAQIMDFMVARYGEFVQLRPDTTGANLILWLAAPIMFVIAIIVGVFAIRARRPVDTRLTADEQAELDKILRQ
ncbi:MAG: cytochrome c-type biogenesis protein [Pseudomonadota bacterium]